MILYIYIYHECKVVKLTVVTYAHRFSSGFLDIASAGNFAVRYKYASGNKAPIPLELLLKCRYFFVII